MALIGGLLMVRKTRDRDERREETLTFQASEAGWLMHSFITLAMTATVSDGTAGISLEKVE